MDLLTHPGWRLTAIDFGHYTEYLAQNALLDVHIVRCRSKRVDALSNNTG